MSRAGLNAPKMLTQQNKSIQDFPLRLSHLLTSQRGSGLTNTLNLQLGKMLLDMLRELALIVSQHWGPWTHFHGKFMAG